MEKEITVYFSPSELAETVAALATHIRRLERDQRHRERKAERAGDTEHERRIVAGMEARQERIETAYHIHNRMAFFMDREANNG